MKGAKFPIDPVKNSQDSYGSASCYHGKGDDVALVFPSGLGHSF